MKKNQFLQSEITSNINVVLNQLSIDYNYGDALCKTRRSSGSTH